METLALFHLWTGATPLQPPLPRGERGGSGRRPETENGLDGDSLSTVEDRSFACAPRAFAYLLAFLTLAGLGLRLYRLDFESLWMDELSTVETFFHPLGTLVAKAADVGQPPLDNLIGALVANTGLGGSDWWVRFPPALLGGGAVALLGLLVRRLSGPGAGLIAALLLAVCPLHQYLSQEARPYSIFFCLGLATVLAYLSARAQSSRRAWIVFGVLLFLTLMTRWTDPHFLVLGLVLFSVLRLLVAPKCVAERARFRATFWSVTGAYLLYAPFFWIVLSHSGRSVAEQPRHVFARAGAHLAEWFAGTFHGYSTRTVFAAQSGSGWVLVVSGVMAALGVAVVVVRAVRHRSESAAFILAALLPFPLVYAVVFASLGNALPKPQYLLFGTTALLALTAIGIDGVRGAMCSWKRRPANVTCLALVLLLVVPMTRVVLESLDRRDKRDWRGVMGYLKEHSVAEDAFAVLATDTVPPVFHVAAYGRARYGPEVAKFLEVGLGSTGDEMANGAWARNDNTVWIIGYKDRMYLGYDQFATPGADGHDVRVHDFSGLFLMESKGREAGADRLVEAFSMIYSGLPDGRSLVAPAMLAARYEAERGLSRNALNWIDVALRQCGSAGEREILAREWIAPLEARLQSALGVEHHARAEERGGAAEPLPGGEPFIEQKVRRSAAEERLQEDHPGGE